MSIDMKHLSRREFVTWSGAIGSTLLLVACAPPSAQSSEESAAAVPREEQVTIVAKAWPGSPFETESILAAIDQFHEEYPNYAVDWQTEPESYGQKVLTQIAAGTPPDTIVRGIRRFLQLGYARGSIRYDSIRGCSHRFQ